MARIFGRRSWSDAMDKRDDDDVPQHLVPSLPHGAPGFLCPSCECPLHYEGSHGSDLSDALIDLKDYYRCPAGCGTYEHERHTHRLRLLDAGYNPTPRALRHEQ